MDMNCERSRECNTCKVTKTMDCFYRDKSQRGGYRGQCKDCYKEAHLTEETLEKRRLRQIKWRAFSGENARTLSSSRKQQILYKYGIWPEKYDEILASQGGCCAICCRRPTQEKWMGLYVDHCHVTGKIRGLLCRECNHGLGNFRDNPQILHRATNYILNRKNINASALVFVGKSGALGMSKVVKLPPTPDVSMPEESFYRKKTMDWTKTRDECLDGYVI